MFIRVFRLGINLKRIYQVLVRIVTQDLHLLTWAHFTKENIRYHEYCFESFFTCSFFFFAYFWLFLKKYFWFMQNVLAFLIAIKVLIFLRKNNMKAWYQINIIYSLSNLVFHMICAFDEYLVKYVIRSFLLRKDFFSSIAEKCYLLNINAL